jgi:hypothetical protein
MLTKATASVKATQAKNTDTVEASRSMAELPLLPLQRFKLRRVP